MAAVPAACNEQESEVSVVSHLSFKPEFESDRLAGLDLPVEVRKTNLALVATGRTSQRIEVPAGDYHVIANLPGGQKMQGYVKLGEDDQKEVQLRVDQDEVAASPDEEESRYIWGSGTQWNPPALTRGLEAMGAGREAKLRLFTGNLLSDLFGLLDASPDSQLGKARRSGSIGVTEYEVRQSNATLVQLLQPKRPTVNAALPMLAAAPGDARVVLVTQPDGGYTLTVQMQQQEINSLIRYLESGQLAQATQLSYSPAVDAEHLLREKMANPIGAVVGAYALLRLGELSRLHEWTANLMGVTPNLGDGLVIRAEHLARTGRHNEALLILVQLPQRGLPMFSDGLSYALTRLGNYLRPRTTTPFDPGLIGQATTLLDKLTNFAPFVDYGRFVLTFTGLDPSDPDDTKLDELDYDDEPGLKVSE
jgi:hypothetical protein